MLTLIAVKVLSAVALAVGLNGPALASELKPSWGGEQSEQVAEYKIDESPRSVVTEWKAAHPSAVLIAVHGFGLHKGSFADFAQTMGQRNITTYALDVRGFGGWGVQSRRRLDFDKTFEDLTALVNAVRSEHPGKPIFLIGESMGGAIALKYSAMNNGMVDGVISSVPANDRFAKVRTAISVGTSYILTVGGKISLKHLLVERVFDNKELQQDWRLDPNSKLRFTLGELIALTKFMRDAESSAVSIDRLPVLMVQGERDRLVKPQSTARIFQDLRTTDKQLLERPQGEHLTFEDGQFDDNTIAQVQSWITRHTESPLLSASAR